MLILVSDVGILQGIISMSEVEMIKFINKSTGGAMWVDEKRADEYKAAGHKPAEEKPAEKPAKKQPAKKTR